MLEQLFGSKTRSQLLRTFFQNPETAFFVRELTRKIDAHINAVRHELVNLQKLGLVEEVIPEGTKGANKKHFRLNQKAIIFPELKALFTKSRVLVEKDLTKRLLSAGKKISYFALTGRFFGRTGPTDLLIVGDIDRRKFSMLVREFEVAFGHEINYTILDDEEMRYRMEVMDRFLYSILDEPKLVVVDDYFGAAVKV